MNQPTHPVEIARGWWRCPADPPCGHPGVFHDIYDFDDERPTCCVEGCTCGQPGGGAP